MAYNLERIRPGIKIGHPKVPDYRTMVPQDSFTWNEIVEELSDLYKLLSAEKEISMNRHDAYETSERGLPYGTGTWA